MEIIMVFLMETIRVVMETVMVSVCAVPASLVVQIQFDQIWTDEVILISPCTGPAIERKMQLLGPL